MIVFKKFNLQDYQNNLIVTDKNIARLYGISGDNVYYAPQGEQAKTFGEAEKLCKWLLSKGLERNGVIVAVGGGSVGDMAGFVASVYKRGVKLIHVPTTFVAQIDSSIGGKTALDMDDVKNAVGTFYAADTYIDADFLKTLDSEQKQNGKGELLKYRMLSDGIDKVSLSGDIMNVIKACVEFKESLCLVDPFDKGARQQLNLGHTIGHAMELNCKLSHGEAVANGLYYEITLARKLGLCSEEYADKWHKEIASQFDIVPVTEEILALTTNDKKNVDGKIGFILPDKFQRVFVTFDELKTHLL